MLVWSRLPLVNYGSCSRSDFHTKASSHFCVERLLWKQHFKVAPLVKKKKKNTARVRNAAAHVRTPSSGPHCRAREGPGEFVQYFL